MIQIDEAVVRQILGAFAPFVLANSSEEFVTLVVRSEDITKASAAITALRRMLEQPAIKQSLTTEQPAQQALCEHPCGDIKCAVLCKRHPLGTRVAGAAHGIGEKK